MTLIRNVASLMGVMTLAATAAQAQAGTKQCSVDENSPKEVATAAFMVQQTRAVGDAKKRADGYKRIVKSLTEKGDRLGNPVGRNYQLGKVFFAILEDSTMPRMVRRADLGFVTEPETAVDVAIYADSVMRIVETTMPECVSLTSTWRRQRAWLQATQNASRLYNAGNLDSATLNARRAIVLDPTAPYAYSVLASVAQRNNDFPTAIAMTRKSAEAALSDTVFADQRRLSLYNLGILIGSQAESAKGEEQKRIARESATWFQTYLKEAPPTDESAPSARSSLARMLSLAGDTAAVKETYAAVLSDPAKYGEYDLIQAGLAASRAGRDADAVQLFSAAVTQNPYSRDGLFNISATLFNMGQHQKELPYVKRLVELDPNNPENWRIMAGAYQGLSKSEKVVKVKNAYTDSLVRAFKKFQEMPTAITFRSFQHDGKSHSVSGTVENRGTATGNYKIVFEFLDRAGKVLATETATVGPVAAKAKADFKVRVEGDAITSFRYAPVP